jgi:hypothetical protein
MELGSDGGEKGQAGRGQEAEPVDPFYPEHLGQPAPDDLSGDVAVAGMIGQGILKGEVSL